MSGPLEGGDVWGPGRVPHGASPPSSGPATSHPAGPLEPEATYQREAEDDAVRRELERVTSAGYSVEGLLHDRFRLGAALAVAERERDQARQALRRIADTDDKPGSFGWDAILRLRKIAEDALAGEPDAAP